jgi:hypothetical protein
MEEFCKPRRSSAKATGWEPNLTVHWRLIEIKAGSIFDACNEAAGDSEIVIKPHF